MRTTALDCDDFETSSCNFPRLWVKPQVAARLMQLSPEFPVPYRLDSSMEPMRLLYPPAAPQRLIVAICIYAVSADEQEWDEKRSRINMKSRRVISFARICVQICIAQSRARSIGDWLLNNNALDVTHLVDSG